MSARRLYTDQRLDAGMVVRLEAGPARHLVRVLRATPGDPVVLFNGDGREWSAQLTAVDGPEVCTVRVVRGRPAGTESPLAVTLVQAIGKGEKMDWCFQKAVELGAAAIVPVMSERTEVKMDLQRAARRARRWRGIVIAACEQCGRAVVPEVLDPMPLARFQAGSGTRLFLNPDGNLSPGGLPAPVDGAIVVAVGPEGGFSSAESSWLMDQGFDGLCLGPRVLRTETAGLAALAILQARFGDLG